MAAYASLVSLMHLIHDLERHPSPPISLDKQLIDPITEHVTFFQEFLHDYNSPFPVADDDEEEAADPLEMRIAATAYAAEDAIESHIVKTIQQLRSNNDDGSIITRLLNCSCFRSPKEPNNANDDEKIESINRCHILLQSVIEEMDSVKKVVVVKVNTENKKKKEKFPVVHDQVSITNIPASVARNKTMVGSDDVLLEIMEKLTGGRLDRQVIPIEGMGGIGKTFLAKSIYARPLIKEHFDICAWATISQQYNTRELLCEVLSQATNINKEQLSGKNVDELGSMLHKHLFGRRFLIVMDDMWSIDAWDMIQRFFPNNENRSRVLVTTRLSQLSSQLNGDDYSIRMSFLDEASSWILFSKTVFGEESCPSELEEIGEKIVKNCRGLPLSIAVVGGLLKKMDGTRASWASIRDNLSSVVNMENENHCLRLLKMSYDNLPVYLRPCFLYMGVFKEDKEIRVSKLVKLWISEEFLKPTNGEALETTARVFLQDLMDRNLILIGKLGSTGSIKSCKIHDLVRDMCLKEGQKERFYHIMGQCNPPPQGMNTQRRVVIPENTSNGIVIRDMISLSYGRSVISDNDYVPPLPNLGLMRTLHANDFYKIYRFNFLKFQHVNMRYLSVKGGAIFSFQQASLFWNLQTLIISDGYMNKPTFLADFWKMPQLRHVEFKEGHLLLPDPSISCDGDSVVVMENLHTLKGVSNLKCSEGVLKRIPNIKKLEILYFKPKRKWNHVIDRCFGGNIKYDEDEYFFGNIKYLCRLESLSFAARAYFLNIPQDEYNKFTFPHSLKKLSLSMLDCFDWEDSIWEKIGSLPLLEKLRLEGGFFPKGKWETVEGQFPCLKYLELKSYWSLKSWTAAEEGSDILPRLEHLRLHYLSSLKKIPCELGNISTLKSIELLECGEEAVKCAKEIVEEQVELQGGEDQLTFHVFVRLKGENLQLG